MPGSVLHTLPNGMNRTREPLQIGAEIYGHAGIESDVEIQRLMMRALEAARVKDVYLDIGHVAIFRSLVRRARRASSSSRSSFARCRRKTCRRCASSRASSRAHARSAGRAAGALWRPRSAGGGATQAPAA